jgi:flavin reductase (DIM6/NTAB) family NADH-FMN oxidoreductase RutF
MPKTDVHFASYLSETVDVLSHDGALLVTADKSGQANIMTIGWGTFGWIWSKPMFLVMVRPSRYSYELLEEHGEFTVNVPGKSLAEAVAYCGVVSGRNFDKFAEKGLTASRGKRVTVPVIRECVVHYECSVVHKNDILPAELMPAIDKAAYSDQSYHRVYYGEILAAYADVDAPSKLREIAAW